MSAYKQAGISLNKALSIAARTVRSSLKPEFKAAAEKRGVSEVRAIKISNGVTSEAKPLSKN